MSELLQAVAAAVQRARTSMTARADRTDRLADAQYHLDLWRDHGTAAELGAAIRILRGES